MHPERTFTRSGITVTTSKPAVATQLIAEGWEEAVEFPTDRPEPDGTVANVPAPTAAQTVDAGMDGASKPAGRRRRVEAGESIGEVGFTTPPN